jgi:hypothetical protein
MPRDGAIVFGDLAGKLGSLRVVCSTCERGGSYRVARLILERGRDAKIVDWLAEITANCPRKLKPNMNDQCGARCPDLVTVL